MACHTRDTVDFHRTAGTERVRQRRLDVARAQAANEEKPSYYLAWIQVESADVAEQYARLIAEARRVAGRHAQRLERPVSRHRPRDEHSP